MIEYPDMPPHHVQLYIEGELYHQRETWSRLKIVVPCLFFMLMVLPGSSIFAYLASGDSSLLFMPVASFAILAYPLFECWKLYTGRGWPRFDYRIHRWVLKEKTRTVLPIRFSDGDMTETLDFIREMDPAKVFKVTSRLASSHHIFVLFKDPKDAMMFKLTV